MPARDGKAPWHPRVVQWWAAVWRSPMAVEFIELDRHEMYLLADLHQLRIATTSTKGLVMLTAEIRHQASRFGLDPLSRRRLQWEIKPGEPAGTTTAAPKRRAKDHRHLLKDPRKVLAFPSAAPATRAGETDVPA